MKLKCVVKSKKEKERKEMKLKYPLNMNINILSRRDILPIYVVHLNSI